MIADKTTIWTVIALLGVGTFLIRFSFLGLIGGRKMPDWGLQHLKYVAVGVMPALIAPLIVWPAPTGGIPDPARLEAALVGCVVGIWRHIVCGAGRGGKVIARGRMVGRVEGIGADWVMVRSVTSSKTFLFVPKWQGDPGDGHYERRLLERLRSIDVGHLVEIKWYVDDRLRVRKIDRVELAL